MLTPHNARAAFEAAAASLPDNPNTSQGRGIVIPGGGHRYFPSAWVCIRRLRDLGCHLPIELWHLGSTEMSDQMRRLVEPLGVTCVDAIEIRRRHPVRILNGWELKAFSILHSRFEQVLMTDADDFAVIDPAWVFECPEYRRTGAIFWADDPPLPPEDPIWELTGIPYRDEPSVESCQVVIDKKRCWKALALTMWMNEHSDFWYRQIYGDKDTFHLAWRKLGLEYAMPPFPLWRIAFTNCHTDFDGRLAFLHRCHDKWRLESPNRHIPGFVDETFAREYLRQLGERWTERPNVPFRVERADDIERKAANHLSSRVWNWTLGGRSGTLRFLSNGWIENCRSRHLQTWGIHVPHSEPVLCIHGETGLTCRLVAASPMQTCWLGRSALAKGQAAALIETTAGAVSGEVGPAQVFP